MHKGHRIETLIDLHEQIIDQGGVFLGYDNAHAVKLPKKFKYAGQRVTYDHKHRHVSDKGVLMNFRMRNNFWSTSSTRLIEC